MNSMPAASIAASLAGERYFAIKNLDPTDGCDSDFGRRS
jgi:hypothetical protein